MQTLIHNRWQMNYPVLSFEIKSSVCGKKNNFKWNLRHCLFFYTSNYIYLFKKTFFLFFTDLYYKGLNLCGHI